MGGAEGGGATLDHCDPVGAAEPEHVEAEMTGEGLWARGYRLLARFVTNGPRLTPIALGY
jgi:hypothetical protein